LHIIFVCHFRKLLVHDELINGLMYRLASVALNPQIWLLI
jgi:hypothetical protein